MIGRVVYTDEPDYMEPFLIPAQKTARDGILAGLQIDNVAVLRGDEGSGKTTVLRDLHGQIGGAFLDARALVERLAQEHPLAIEEALTKMLREALETADAVTVDDLHLITAVLDNSCVSYPREGLVNVPLTAILAEGEDLGKKFIFATDEHAPTAILSRAFRWSIKEFGVSDYRILCQIFLNGAAEGLDFPKIHRFAPKLTAHPTPPRLPLVGEQTGRWHRPVHRVPARAPHGEQRRPGGCAKGRFTRSQRNG